MGYRKRTLRAPTINDDLWNFIARDTPWPDRCFTQFVVTPLEVRAIWNEHREHILNYWVITNPGTRPHHWWLFDAPRLQLDRDDWRSTCYDKWKLIEHRPLVGGAGEPDWSHGFSYSHGCPVHWVGDPAKPPIFESTYGYLLRHNLLLGKEKMPKREPAPELCYVEPN